MKKVFDAGSAVEAYMVRDLLRQAGISARIDGEYLQGAIGELPAAGLVSIAVEDEDYAAARVLVEQWDTAQPAQAPSPPRPSKGRGALLFFIGLSIGVGATAGFLRAPTINDDIDYNRDGKVDARWVYAPNGTVVGSEQDRNFDGRIDQVLNFSAGMVESSRSDDDFDGIFETVGFFKHGQLERSEVDTNGDTIVDLRMRFQHGVVVSEDQIDPHTARTRRTGHFQLGRLTHAEIDTDGDGKMDTRLRYDALGEEMSRAPM